MIGALDTAAAGRLLAALGLGASLALGGAAASGDANVVTRAVGDLSASVAAQLAPPAHSWSSPESWLPAQDGVPIRGTLAIEPPSIDVRAMLGADVNANAAVPVTWAAVPAPSGVDLNATVDAGARADTESVAPVQTTSPVTTSVGGLEAHSNLDLTVGR